MSPFTRFYYSVKPFVPRRVRMFFRSWYARRIRRASTFVWPILESAGVAPAGWPGWPDGRQFAFVLTHDVESATGVAKVRQLAELEMSLGFRSSFNFIPEGGYTVPEDLRRWLLENGFEVGVHDHRHDGKLYSSHAGFQASSRRINHFLESWNAVGFRSGFMLRKLDWLHDLNIAYDASTFDTDPFEPQPDGAHTIFPFWVPRKSSSSLKQSSSSSKPGTPIPKPETQNPKPQTQNPRPETGSASGYVELPYTLVQDSTLFFLLGERSAWLWDRKLEWLVRRSGMALLNLHPDYVNFANDQVALSEFPVRLYAKFLRDVRTHYADRMWHALPREVAQFAFEHRAVLSIDSVSKSPSPAASAQVPRRIWIDLENTPHIPFFQPIIRELRQRGYDVVVSARDAYQTCEMADKVGLAYRKIDRHYGKNRLLKLLGLFARSARLISFVRDNQPCLALNHGSRTQNLISNLMGIPSVTIMDYEHGQDLPLWRPRWEILPEVVQADSLSLAPERVRKYSGIKEDVYVPEFKPDPAIFAQLGLDSGGLVVTVRPPATEAHYHNPEAEILFERFIERALLETGIQAVVLPRNKRQEVEIRERWPHWFTTPGKIIIPAGVVHGLNLVWASDLVVSGGGTMNREAAAMGVPVYSIFRGTIGAVDRQLQQEGRLILIENPAQIDSLIELKPRAKDPNASFAPRQALRDIIQHIEEILATQRRSER